MDKPITTFQFKDGKSLEIYQDLHPEDPRNWSNLSTMAFFHKRYRIGDKDHGIDKAQFSSWEEMEKHIIEEMGAEIVRPVSMYDHSSHIAFAIGEKAFNQVGFIFVTREMILAEYGHESYDDGNGKEKAMRCIEGELEEYNQFHRGQVYGFILRDEPCDKCGGKGKELESCWGFYGDADPLKNGMIDSFPEYKGEIESALWNAYANP